MTAVIQHATTQDTSGGASDTIAFGSAVTAGNFLICVVDCGSSVTAISVSDNNGNTWHAVGSIAGPNADSQVFQMFYVWNANAGATTVTVTYTGTQGNCTRTVAELSGILNTSDPLKGSNTTKTGTVATGANGVSTNSSTPTAAGCCAIAAVSDTTVSVAPTVAVGTGFTLIDNNPGVAGTNTSLNAEFQDLTGTPATSGTWTFTNGSGDQYQAIIAFFAPAVTGPPPQKIAPDADLATGSWATTPLWSKLDEDPAGGDVISETAA